MKKSDCVEVIAEKEKYAREGIHKGMQGKTIYIGCDGDCWCVSFLECTDKSKEIVLPIDTKDLKYLPDGIVPKRNEEVKRSFGEFIEGDGFKEMDCVKVIVEKEKYAKAGVHKGMYGWICDPRTIGGTWLVNFPQCYDRPDIATEAILEEDMIKVPVMYAKVNEEIKEKFGD